MIPRLYAGATTLAAPALGLWLRRRARRGKEVPERLAERRGIEATPRPPGTLLWLHAASVGETVSILPVLAAISEAAPGITVLLTTGTVTSGEVLARRLPEMGLRLTVLHRFVPLDVPRWVARFLTHWRPDAAGFVESEIWPNLIASCRVRGIRLMLINARLSQGSFARWRRLPHLARHLFGGFAVVQAQSADDAARLAALGAPAGGLVGNLKFAAPPLPAAAGTLAELRAVFAGRPVWLAASTHPGEETIAMAVHAALAPRHPRLLTVIVPRHPARGAEIAAPRRALGQGPPAGAGVWIADTLGELGAFYATCDIVFVGGSLVVHGGQNMLEPARLGCAIAVGPHVRNFAEPVAALNAAGGVARVADAEALTAWVDAMLRDAPARRAMAAAARAAASRDADLPRQVARTLLDLLR